MEVDLAIDMKVDMDMVMKVVFHQMSKDPLSKWFIVAIDFHRSQVDGK